MRLVEKIRSRFEEMAGKAKERVPTAVGQQKEGRMGQREGQMGEAKGKLGQAVERAKGKVFKR